MTIERMLRRGIFPILSERPLDESAPVNGATGKVYVVEVGAYSDRYIDAIFTTRELAEAFVADRQRRAFERDGVKAHQEVVSYSWESIDAKGSIITFFGSGGVATLADGRTINGEPQYRDVPPETFEEFVRRHTWNEFGDIEEYDIWDVLPVVLIGRSVVR